MYSIGSERGEGSGLAKGETIKDTCQGYLPSSQVGVMCANRGGGGGEGEVGGGGGAGGRQVWRGGGMLPWVFSAISFQPEPTFGPETESDY